VASLKWCMRIIHSVPAGLPTARLRTCIVGTLEPRTAAVPGRRHADDQPHGGADEPAHALRWHVEPGRPQRLGRRSSSNYVARRHRPVAGEPRSASPHDPPVLAPAPSMPTPRVVPAVLTRIASYSAGSRRPSGDRGWRSCRRRRPGRAGRRSRVHVSLRTWRATSSSSEAARPARAAARVAARGSRRPRRPA